MEFLKSCDQMAADVGDAIHDLIGTKEGGRVIRMGADGTPTKLIDQVAED
jgi:myo-inositol-1(or 4)-monophosphatase